MLHRNARPPYRDIRAPQRQPCIVHSNYSRSTSQNYRDFRATLCSRPTCDAARTMWIGSAALGNGHGRSFGNSLLRMP